MGGIIRKLNRLNVGPFLTSTGQRSNLVRSEPPTIILRVILNEEQIFGMFNILQRNPDRKIDGWFIGWLVGFTPEQSSVRLFNTEYSAFSVGWLVGWLGLWHINLSRLFNAKSIFMQIISSISNNSI